MANIDILDDLLSRTGHAVRKAEGVVEPTRNNQGDESGYDLTNPNLHHGADDKYAPTPQIVSKSGSVAAPAEEVFHEARAIDESSRRSIGDNAPSLTTIADQSANQGQAFSLNVSNHFAAPAAGDTLTFTAKLPAGLGIDAHTGVISGTPTGGDYGNNPVTVTATDAHGIAISESFHLAVGDSGPTATAIADQSANEGQAFSLNVSSHFAAPAAGDTLTFSAKLPAGLSINAHTGVISGAPTDGDYGSNAITVTATDAHGKAISESFHLAVGDSGPTATAIADQSANEGQAFSLNVSSHFATPAAGDTLTFSAKLPAGLSINAHTGVISGVPTDGDYGNNTVTVTATDAHGKAISESFNLQVGDSGPTATVIADQSANEGKSFSLNVASHFAAPAAGDTLTFSASLPAGLSINAHTGVISGTPTDSDYGNNAITVTATDAHGKAISESFHLQVGDSGPTGTTIADQSANEGKSFSLNVSSHFVAPAAGDTLTFSASLPTGLSINSHTGVISGTPTDSDYGNNAITVTATDAHGKAISESFHLQVGDSGPTATVIANQNAFEGQSFSLNVSSHFAAPAAGDALTFSASLPTGLSIDAHTGVISGVPTDSDYGNNAVTVTATDAHGKAISESFKLTVGDSGPTATVIANQSANEGQAFSLNVSSHFAAPAAGDTLTFTAKLPTGLSIDAHTGVISGTPTDSDFGNNTVTVTATDAHGKAISESFHLAVGDTGPTGTAIANQSALEGQSFSLNVSSHFAAPAAGDALTFSAKLPAGLSINAHTGVISGTPTDGDYGSNTVTVTATDAHGKAISESFNLQVGDSGPTATVIADQSANEGKAFSLNVASHFTAPAAGDTLTFSASLPAGLSINAHTGVISGTPTDGDYGNNAITVTATDAHGKAISESFNLQVGDSGPTGTAIADQSANEGKAFSLNVASHFKAPAAGDALTFSASLPTGLSIDAHTGVISGTPTDSDYGNNPVTVTATDAHGKAISESFHLAIGDSGPTATAIANQSAYEGQSFSLNVSSHFVAPAAGDVLTFSASLPTGLSIDAHTGVISGTPTDSDFGNNAITVTATDAHGKAISESFHLQVGDSGPTGTTIADQSANEGQSFSLNVSSHFAAPAAGDALTFSASLPTGLSIDSHTGLISGTPTDSDYGNDAVTVTATDAHGKAISESFHLQVGDSGPTATAIADQSANEGQAFSLNVSSHFAAPAAGDALTFSASLPAGLSIDSHTGVISGTPTDGDYTSNAHAYNFNFTSFDGTFTVTGQLNTASSLDAVGGYDVTGVAGSVVGPNGGAISSLINNPNPSAESISPDGVFIYDNVLLANSSPSLDYGGLLFTSNNLEYNIFYQNGQYQLIETLSPNGTAYSEQDGTFTISAVPASDPITVTATDAHGQAISESFHLTVGDSGPTATPIADQSAYEGQNLSLDVSSHFAAPAAGDALTFSAALPTGLSIDAHTGIISGAPTVSDVGNTPITVTATDAHGQAISEHLNLAVADHNDTFFIASHSGNIAITGSNNWTDTVDLHNIGQNASFNLTEFASDGHVVQSWTGLVVDGSAQSDHNLTLAQGDHAQITVNHIDGSASDHIALQHIDHIKY
jgi:Putative Ig domain